MPALKSFSDNSNICHWLSFSIQEEIFPVLHISHDLYLTPVHLHIMRLWNLFKSPVLGGIVWNHCGKAEGCHLVTTRWRQKSRFPTWPPLSPEGGEVLITPGWRWQFHIPMCSWHCGGDGLLTTGRWWKSQLSPRCPLASPQREDGHTFCHAEVRILAPWYHGSVG